MLSSVFNVFGAAAKVLKIMSIKPKINTEGGEVPYKSNGTM